MEKSFFLYRFSFHLSAFPTVVVALVTSLGFLLIVIIGIGTKIYRKKRFEKTLASMLWMIDYDEINFDIRNFCRYGSFSGIGSFGSHVVDKSSSIRSLTYSETAGQLFTKVGIYRGNVVAVRRISRENVPHTRPLLVELNNVSILLKKVNKKIVLNNFPFH